MTARRRTVPTPAPASIARLADEHQQLQQAYSTYAEPLTRDLEQAGFPVDRLRDLRRRGVGGPAALPVLLHWLPQVTFAPLKVDVIYALGSRWARPAACRPLIEEHTFLRDEPGEAAFRVRSAILATLERIADESVFDDVVALASDTTLGAERGMAIVALGNMRRTREHVIPLLLELLNDDSVELFALLGLSKLGAREVIHEFAFRTRHHNELIRRLAVKTIAAWTSPPHPPA